VVIGRKGGVDVSDAEHSCARDCSIYCHRLSCITERLATLYVVCGTEAPGCHGIVGWPNFQEHRWYLHELAPEDVLCRRHT
jgi:hypothetical protein